MQPGLLFVRGGQNADHESRIAALGAGVTGYTIGQRVIVTLAAWRDRADHSCLDGHQAQCGGRAVGGWRFGTLPLEAFAAGLGDHKLVTTLCPGGKERMRRLMNIVASRRVSLTPLITHRFKLDDIEQAYELFASQRDGVMKVAITPCLI